MAEDFAAAVASLRTRRGAAGGSDRLAWPMGGAARW